MWIHAAALCAQPAPRAINAIRYIEHADGFWRSEQDVGEEDVAVGLQRRASQEAAAGEWGAAAKAAKAAEQEAAAEQVAAAAATMIEEVRVPSPLYLRH